MLNSKSEAELRVCLSAAQFRVLRKAETEAPGTGRYNSHFPASGVYACAGCRAPLYEAAHKFDSECRWPAFFDALPGRVLRREDLSIPGRPRTVRGRYRTACAASHERPWDTVSWHRDTEIICAN
eukprot:Polyplicarium_translucidae@DN2310_c0_g1_i2.p4